MQVPWAVGQKLAVHRGKTRDWVTRLLLLSDGRCGYGVAP